MCCGSNRAAARAATVVAARGNASPSVLPVAPLSATTEIVFEYAGEGSASIRGPVSGRVYRFGGRGDRIRVDARDRPGLVAIASLRWIR